MLLACRAAAALGADGGKAGALAAVTTLAAADLVRVVLAVDVAVASPIQRYTALLVALEAAGTHCKKQRQRHTRRPISQLYAASIFACRDWEEEQVGFIDFKGKLGIINAL